MAFAPGDVLRLSVEHRFLGVQTVTTWTFRNGGTSTYTNDEVIGDVAEWVDMAYGPIQGQLSQELDYVQTSIYNLTTEEPMGVSLPGMYVGGTNISEPSVTGIAVLVRAITPALRVVGKRFLPGFTEAQLTLGIWTTQVVGYVLDFLSRTLTDWVGSSGCQYEAVVWSSKTRTAQRVVEWAVSFIPAYQRRRREGAGA